MSPIVAAADAADARESDCEPDTAESKAVGPSQRVRKRDIDMVLQGPLFETACSTTSCSKAAKRRKQGWCPTWEEQTAGPSSPEELDSWCDHMLTRLPPAAFRNVLSKFSNGLDLTTTYSGSGAAEEVLGFIGDTARQHSPGLSVDIKLHSACDCARGPQQALMHNPHRPAHIFTDVCAMVPPVFARRVERLRLQHRARAEAKTRCLRHSRRRISIIKTCSDAFLADLKALIMSFESRADPEPDGNTTPTRSFCIIHQTLCPVAPAKDNSHSTRFHIEAAGTTCVAFSAMSASSLQWLHESSTPCACWIFHVRRCRPHLVVHECVPRFLASIFAFFFADLYSTESVVFCTSEQGLPNTRTRRYTLLKLLHIPALMEYTRSTFGQLAFRSLQADARIYLSSNEATLREYHAALAQEKGLPSRTCTGRELAWPTLLSPSAYKRLAGHAGMVMREHGLSDFAFLLVNISQNSDWMFPSNSLAPALLRSSDLWVLAPDLAARPLHPEELMSIQGMPVRSARRMETGVHKALLAGALTRSDVCALVGNSMHHAAVGSVLLFALAAYG